MMLTKDRTRLSRIMLWQRRPHGIEGHRMDRKLVGKQLRIAALSLLLGASVCIPPVSAQDQSPSFTDKLKGFFGGSKKSDDQQPPLVDPMPKTELDCPQVTIRAGASTYAVAEPGKQAVGDDVKYQATITKMARDCTLMDGQITAHIGIQGRVIVGPSGAPPTIEVPLRVAVVQGGVNEKTIATKAYRTTVTMAEDGSVPFTLVADDLVYPLPPDAVADSYIFYIGFDPQALAPEPKAHPKKRR
jgi:hypothetical protein